MGIRDLQSMEPGARGMWSWMILRDDEYIEEIGKGRPFFTNEEIDGIEDSEDNKEGITFPDIQNILSRKHIIIKSPTFKKYISQKLISNSTGVRKTDKGILGLYPPKVIREINLIKYAVYANRDFASIGGRFLDGFKTNAFELIQIAGESDFSSIWDVYDKAEFILRISDKLLSEGLKIDTERNEVYGLISSMVDSMDKAMESFHKIGETLQNIEIPGKLGFKMIVDGKNSSK